MLIHVKAMQSYCRFEHQHHAVYLMTEPQPITKWAHRVQSGASSLNFQYHLVSLRSFSSCLHFLPRLPITSVFPSITCFRRQFLRKIWPSQWRILRMFFFMWMIICTDNLCACNLSKIQWADSLHWISGFQSNVTSAHTSSHVLVLCRQSWF